MPSRHDRNGEDRRQQHRRPSHADRRQGGDRRADAHKAFARRLPAEYAKLDGRPNVRVVQLVNRFCSGCDESLKTNLAQALLPTLQGISTLDGGVVSDKHQADCEAAVERCVRRHELENGRWGTAGGDKPG